MSGLLQGLMAKDEESSREFQMKEKSPKRYFRTIEEVEGMPAVMISVNARDKRQRRDELWLILK